MSAAQQWLIGRDSPESVVLKIQGVAEPSEADTVVCFDFFDTIVTRTVEPEYTKEMTSHLLSHLLKDQFSGNQIYRHRRQIEEDLCRLNHEKNGELEFSYADLCRDLHTRLSAESRNDSTFPDLEGFSHNMLTIELAVEKRVQQVCPEAKRVLDSLDHSDFTLVLISDFYLPQAAFLKLLDHHQLTPFFKHIYVSTACGMSKGSGRIYPYLC
jgi:FMN phosphatase YigB (HAD superfamily)